MKKHLFLYILFLVGCSVGYGQVKYKRHRVIKYDTILEYSMHYRLNEDEPVHDDIWQTNQEIAQQVNAQIADTLPKKVIVR
jgi:hypothetical protein